MWPEALTARIAKASAPVIELRKVLVSAAGATHRESATATGYELLCPDG